MAIINPNAIPVEWDPDDVEIVSEATTEAVAFEIDGDVQEYIKKHGITFSETTITKKQPDGTLKDIQDWFDHLCALQMPYGFD